MKNNGKGVYKRYDRNMLDRIDNMSSDKDYDPYKAERKNRVENDELFGEINYSEDDEDKENSDTAEDSLDEKSKGMDKSTIFIILGVLGVVALLIFGFVMILK